MLIQFKCPSCGIAHWTDIHTEVEVHMTCSKTRECVRIEINRSLIVKTKVVERKDK